MKSKSRIEIITETTREITFRLESRRARAFLREKCSACGAELFTLNEAVQCSGRIWDEIVRLVENGSIHSVETAQGEIYVCAGSLLEFRN